MHHQNDHTQYDEESKGFDFVDGRNARRRGQAITDNPYKQPHESQQALAWEEGWESCDKELKSRRGSKALATVLGMTMALDPDGSMGLMDGLFPKPRVEDPRERQTEEQKKFHMDKAAAKRARKAAKRANEK